MNKKHIVIAALVGMVAGVVFANRLRSLPLVNKLPSL